MKNIDLGKISIPLDHYASQGNAILGIRGSGKSYTGTYLAERLLDAGVPIVAFDPIGIWRYLRVPAKAGGRGYKVVVAGGEHSDIPLPAHGAAEIMRAAMRDGVSIVFDLYDVAMSKADWRRIVESVGKVLLYENKAHGLRHIFIEEAAEFVPQRVTDQGGVYSVVERLVRMGGNAQLGVTLINQRAEEVNKAVLELCDLLILHRQKGKNSLASLSKWMDVASVSNRSEVGASIPMLKAGECFIWPEGAEAPTKTMIPAKRTFHPDRRQMQKALAVEAKSADVSAFVTTMKTSLAHLAKEAEANDPKLLRARIFALERDLKKGHPAHAGKPGAGKAELAAEFKRGLEAGRAEPDAKGYAEGHVDGVLAARLKVEAEITKTLRVDHLIAAIGNSLRSLKVPRHPHHTGAHARPAPAATVSPHRPPEALQRPSKGPLAGNGAGMKLPPGERAVLTAAAQYPDGVARDQLSVLTGYKRSSRDAYIQRLREKGYVEVSGDSILATEEGVTALGPNYEPLPTGDALLAYWLRRLPDGERKTLEILVQHYPRTLEREVIDESTGYRRSSRDAYLQRLRSRRLVEFTGRGEVKASEELFS